jgi:hypothetical protein
MAQVSDMIRMKPVVNLVAIVVALVYTAAQPSVHFSATWQRPGVARLTWTQPDSTDRACLTRIPANGQPVALDCYSGIATGAQVVVKLGATAPLDGNYRPQAGDRYAVQIGNQVYTDTLKSVVRLPVYLH